MSIKYYNKDGVLELELAENVMELPWFVQVVEESERYLDKVYQQDPSLSPVWYQEYRSKTT